MLINHINVQIHNMHMQIYNIIGILLALLYFLPGGGLNINQYFDY